MSFLKALLRIGFVASVVTAHARSHQRLHPQHDESADANRPSPMPKFQDPYSTLSDAELAERMAYLPAGPHILTLSRDLRPESGAPPITGEGVDVEIVLPENRCETGVLTWGSVEEGYTSCRVLGRGQTVFASLRDLAGLKATQRNFKNWVIAQTPVSIKAEWVKNKEHFATLPAYDYCMFRPDFESDGATITERPDSTLGRFTLDTGARFHGGKEKWGSRPDGKGFQMPVRMTPVFSDGNEAYRKEGVLTRRSDFFIHSHENIRDGMPLESSSTWGCPRLPRNCEAQFQSWVAARNALGKSPVLLIRQE